MALLFEPLLIAPDGSPECFGAKLNQTMAESCKIKLEQAQVIWVKDIFSPVCWSPGIFGPRSRLAKGAILYTDYESARIAMIRAHSLVLLLLNIRMQCIIRDFHNDPSTRYTRVPAACNPADGPSRMSLVTISASASCSGGSARLSRGLPTR